MRPVVAPSPSRTYVAICNRSHWDGHYFRTFTLPARGAVDGWLESNGEWVEGSYTRFHPNTAAEASWYFLNVLNLVACIDGVIPIEQFGDVKDQDEMIASRAQLSLEFYPPTRQQKAA